MKYLSIFILFFASEITYAQCAMCKATIESNPDLVGRAQGINNGILYLMCIPYIAGGIVGYLWYSNSKKNKQKV